MLREDNVKDIGPLRRDLGLEPKRLEDVIRAYLGPAPGESPAAS